MDSSIFKQEYINIKTEEGLETKPIKLELCAESDQTFQLHTVVKQEKPDVEDTTVLSDEKVGEQFLCDQCGFTIFSEQSFTLHVIHHAHQEPQGFKCNECSYQTCYMGDLNTHMSQVHSVDVKFPKEVSQTSFLPKTSILENILKIEEKLLNCSKCHFKSYCTSSLLRHYNNNHAVKLYYCGGRCTFKTKNKNELVTHITENKHTLISKKSCFCCSPGLYRCNKCDYKNFCQKQVVAHMRKFHPLTPPDKAVDPLEVVVWFKCGLCPFKANSESEVGQHLNNFHFSKHNLRIAK